MSSLIDIALPGLYRGKVNLWVEDALTREYLKECWNNDPDIFFLIGGGNSHLQAILKDAENRGPACANVFGVRDRDFGNSNRADWLTAGKTFRLFVLESHEIENHLLDTQALSNCGLNTGHRSSADIDNHLQTRANGFVWYMTCRRVIADLADSWLAAFPKHPGAPSGPGSVVDANSAAQYIVSQPWYAGLSARVASIQNHACIQTLLQNAYPALNTDLSSGAWRQSFSGKELFRHVRGWLYVPTGHSASPSDLDTDLAKAVAQWQVANNRVPAEITELRKALRQRVNLPV